MTLFNDIPFVDAAPTVSVTASEPTVTVQPPTQGPLFAAGIVAPLFATCCVVLCAAIWVNESADNAPAFAALCAAGHVSVLVMNTVMVPLSVWWSKRHGRRKIARIIVSTGNTILVAVTAPIATLLGGGPMIVALLFAAGAALIVGTAHMWVVVAVVNSAGPANDNPVLPTVVADFDDNLVLRT